MTVYGTGGSNLGTTIETAEIEDGAITEIKTDGSVSGSILIPFLWNYTVIQGTWSKNVYAAAVTNMSINNTTNAINDGISYQVFLSKGTYNIYAIFEKYTSRGIAHMYLDATQITTFDTYAGSGTPNTEYTSANFFVTESKVYTFKMIAESKNASATAYQLAPSFLSLIKRGVATS